jgi:hypothetical protein
MRWRPLTPRSVLEKFAAVQMIDDAPPDTDGRELVLTRYTERPEPELLPDEEAATGAAPNHPQNHRQRTCATHLIAVPTLGSTSAISDT